MPIFRNTIRRSRRERVRRIDRAFALVAQIFLIAYFLFVCAAWLSFRPAFRITDVRVEGALAVDVTTIKEITESLLTRPLLWKIDRNNSLLYPKRAILASVKHIDARIKSVGLAVVGHKRLEVLISEYTPALLWCPSENISATTTVMAGCYFADSMGHIFARAPEYSGNPFLVFATKYPMINEHTFLSDFSILPSEEFIKVNLFLTELSHLGLSPRIVREVDAHDFIVVTEKPWTIRFTSTRDPETDVKNLALVLKNLSGASGTTETLESIDLRFENKVFYR